MIPTLDPFAEDILLGASHLLQEDKLEEHDLAWI